MADSIFTRIAERTATEYHRRGVRPGTLRLGRAEQAELRAYLVEHGMNGEVLFQPPMSFYGLALALDDRPSVLEVS